MMEFCGFELKHPVINGSAPTTRSPPARPSATSSSSRATFPSPPFVSKTITPEPRAGNPPRVLGDAVGF